MDSFAKAAPKLHMWRCTTYPDEIKFVLEKQTLTNARRDKPHWAQQGPDATSWDGWAWSNGDGWFWTQEGGWVELIPRFGRRNPRD